VGFFQHPEDVVALLFFQGNDAAVAAPEGADGQVAQVVGKMAGLQAVVIPSADKPLCPARIQPSSDKGTGKQ
jgi:hypothetical protein